MERKRIAYQYLNYLEEGNMSSIIALFDINGTVNSPIYGIKKASDFYTQLNEDTYSSKLELKGLFDEANTSRLALYFCYTWILKNKERVTFDVVDIIEFTKQGKIKTLNIIYDTVVTRTLIEKLNS